MTEFESDVEQGEVVPRTDGDLGIDYLHTQVADAEKEEQVQKDMLLTVGTWITKPDGKDPKVQHGKEDGPDAERVFMRFYHQIELPSANGAQPERGSIGYKLAAGPAHFAHKRDENGVELKKWDLSTKLYMQAKAALVRAGGTYDGPVSVATFLRDYPVRLRVIQMEGNEQYPEPSNLVVSISAVKE